MLTKFLVEEVGAAAVETGFAQTGGDWEVSGATATAFAGASAAAPAAGASWEAGESTGEWGAAPTAEWGAADATKPADSW